MKKDNFTLIEILGVTALIIILHTSGTRFRKYVLRRVPDTCCYKPNPCNLRPCKVDIRYTCLNTCAVYRWYYTLST